MHRSLNPTRQQTCAKKKTIEIQRLKTEEYHESPKLPIRIIPDMQRVLAEVIQVEVSDISLKATTTEKLGFTGREEGISAYAVALLIAAV